MRRILGLFLAVSSALAFAAPAQARDGAPRMPLGRATTPPAGYMEFCARRPGDCQELAGRSGGAPLSGFWRDAFRGDGTSALTPADRAAALDITIANQGAEGRLALTGATLDMLNAVNRQVNGAIAPAMDRADARRADVWSLPLAEGRASGDCEDYVLEKRRALLARGLPAEALAIAVVRTRHGENHAVLVVDTDAGELVLDNRSAWVARWTAVDYRWVKRQSPVDPATWVRVGSL